MHFLTEYRSHTPQKGMGIMPKRGLDVSSCEVFRFYKLVTIKALIEPLSMIVPRRVRTPDTPTQATRTSRITIYWALEHNVVTIY
nr:coronin-2A-like [Oncorhynchus nerka]